MKRSFVEWVQWRIQWIPRKLRLAREHAVWLYRDLRNGIRIWWELQIQKKPIADITRYERQISSQNGEDGILEAIFVKIGTTNKYFVEFGSARRVRVVIHREIRAMLHVNERRECTSKR